MKTAMLFRMVSSQSQQTEQTGGIVGHHAKLYDGCVNINVNLISRFIRVVGGP
jgi:hypothetical protein